MRFGAHSLAIAIPSRMGGAAEVGNQAGKPSVVIVKS